MAVKIRLKRKGRKKLALYDVVVADARAPRDGRFIQKVGRYDPNSNPAEVVLDEDATLKWLLQGAQPTQTVRAMLSYNGILLRKHLQLGVNKKVITQEEADKKFASWKKDRDAQVSKKIASVAHAQEAKRKEQQLIDAKYRAKKEAAQKAVEAVKETPETEGKAAPTKTAVDAPKPAAKTKIALKAAVDNSKTKDSTKEVPSPPAKVKAPEKEMKAPEKEMKAPEKEMKAPEKEMKAPEKEMKAPEKEVKAPEKEMKAPEKEMKAPEKKDSSA